MAGLGQEICWFILFCHPLVDRVLNISTVTVRQRSRILRDRPLYGYNNKSNEKQVNEVWIPPLKVAPGTFPSEFVLPWLLSLNPGVFLLVPFLPLLLITCHCWGFPGGASGKEPTCQCRRLKRHGFNPWVWKISWGGHDNPLQRSCLENPMDWRAWRATVDRVSKSQTWLKQLSMHSCNS